MENHAPGVTMAAQDQLAIIFIYTFTCVQGTGCRLYINREDIYRSGHHE